jgi:hypothetical protein
LILFGFIKQSFSFLKIDLFINKIIQCYKYHQLNSKLNPKILNLIEFFNAYIIEMIIYDKSLISDNRILNIINNFYTNLEKDAINIIKNKRLNKSTNSEIKKNF